MVEAKLLRKKLKNGLIVDKWDLVTIIEKQQAEIEALKTRIERMIEKSSHYESMEHAAGFEAGRQQGMKQERALWQLAASTQEIEK